MDVVWQVRRTKEQREGVWGRERGSGFPLAEGWRILSYKLLEGIFARGNEVKSILAALGVVLVALGVLLAFLVVLRAILDTSWEVLGRPWAILGRSWGGLGAILGRSWSPLGLKNIDFPYVVQ